jgi:hypothetical protein
VKTFQFPAAERTRTTVQTVRTFDRQSNLTDLFAFLRAEHFTGSVTVEIHYGQGAVHCIEVAERRQLKDPALDIAANMS